MQGRKYSLEKIGHALLRIALVGLAAMPLAAWPQSNKSQEVLGYSGIGRIEWNMPTGFQYIMGVPHFTAGRRVLCADGKTTCVMNVRMRSYARKDDARRADLMVGVREAAKEAGIPVPQLREFGNSPTVVYALLTDPRPKQEYRMMAMGYVLNGPATIDFDVLANDEKSIMQVLQVAQRARPIDAVPHLALRIEDYRLVCAERFPAYREAGEKAFKASVFASVDIIDFLVKTRGISPAQARERNARELAEYARGFDAKPEADRRDFCEQLPEYIAEAQSTLIR